MIRRLLISLAVAVLTLGWAGAAAPAQAETTYAVCDGVWVVVDYGSLGGGTTTKCATSYASGTAALKATFGASLENGMVVKVAGKPSKHDVYKNYWSYWQATRKADGSYSGWSYANLGPSAYHPKKGNAEGWHYVSISGSASAPGAKPPVNPVAKPKPSSAKPTASTTKPSASPNKTPSSTATPTVTPTPAETVTPTASSGEPPPTDAGSALPLIVTATVIAAGGAGAGAWWLWKGRTR